MVEEWEFNEGNYSGCVKFAEVGYLSKKKERERKQAPGKATRHFQDTSNKPTPLHQPAVWMAHGVSSSVELLQGSHAVTGIQLRFWAFREYQWGSCAHQMDRSVCPSCSAYWSFNRLYFFSFPFLFYTCNITYLAVSESVSNLAFWIVSNLQQRCFVFLCCYWLTFMAFIFFLFFKLLKILRCGTLITLVMVLKTDFMVCSFKISCISTEQHER